jgi:two-component system NtrC family sensor kinase
MDFAVVAHDLRAPLTAMLGHTQLLATEGLSDAARGRLRVIEAQILRMASFLESCLAPAERPHGARDVDAVALVNAVVAEMAAMCERRNIRVTVSSRASALPTIAGHAGELHRVLMNICINAADAMPHGGELRIQSRPGSLRDTTSPAVDVEIADNGPGIPADVMRHVFDRGFTTKTSAPGAGLGLAICRDIVLAHDGAIRLNSLVGHGTTVTVSLPTKSDGDRR